MDAAGSDFVIVETVGVGQDEVDIAALADVTVVVLVPGMGDDVQAIKAGIMEIADIFVINKADQPGAEQTSSARSRHAGLGSATLRSCRTVATEGTGIAELLDSRGASLAQTPRSRLAQARAASHRPSRHRRALAR